MTFIYYLSFKVSYVCGECCCKSDLQVGRKRLDYRDYCRFKGSHKRTLSALGTLQKTKHTK